MNNVIDRIRDVGVVPVVVIENADDAVSLADALIRGGLPCAEVTFRTDAAEAAIRAMRAAFPDMLIGAGTVLSTEQADRAAAAGAQFIVSPGLNPEVVKHCQKAGLAVVPGVMTPTEIEAALGLGVTTVKFFPAEAAGGLRMIKALAAPYGRVSFLPTGGISAENVGAYLAYDRVLACGGSWMVKKALIAEGRFEEIRDMAAEAAQIVKEVRGQTDEA